MASFILSDFGYHIIMTLKLRPTVKIKNKTLIVKLSSLAVTHKEGGIDRKLIARICKDISHLKTEFGWQVVIVSSGAINAGKPFMKTLNKQVMAQMQAASAIGQPLLMQAFQKEFSKHNLNIAQILLTHEDLKNKRRSLNIRSSLLTLLQEGIIPVINENDSVSFEEITVGDNDQLSAMICETLGSNLLCMLTKTDGLYTDDPNLKSAKHIQKVHFEENFSSIKTLSKTTTGRGGMKTKLQAVRKLTPLGINVIIGTYERSKPLISLLINENYGTVFTADPEVKIKIKKQWILSRTKNEAIITIDKGAMGALLKNASLLPVGVTKVHGNFNRGDCIKVQYNKKTMAHGVSEYSSKELELIKRKKTSELSNILNHVHSKVVIHKDNLILNK